eukprot:SAG25_NODE_1084_length_4077_cov_8.548768_6_plen_56_part_01
MLSLRLGLTQSPRCDTQHWTTPVCTAVDCFGGGGGGGERVPLFWWWCVFVFLPGGV